MTGFIFLSLALLVIIIWMMAPSLLRKKQELKLDHISDNVSIARERIAELTAQLNNGDIEEDQYKQTVEEIELTLVNDTDQESETTLQSTLSPKYQRSILVLLSTIPFVSFGLYQYWGNPDAINGVTQEQATPAGHGKKQEKHAMSIEQMLQKLEQKLAEDPNNPNGWYMLGRSYMVRKEYDKASQAFAKLHELVGDQPEVLLGMADSMTMSRNGDMSGKPFELIKKALELEPENHTALWLGGMAYSQHGNPKKAIELWNKLLPLLSSDPNSGQEVRALIAQAESQLGVSGSSQATQTKAAEPAPAIVALRIKVDIDAALRNKVNPESFVMVYAQRVEGLKMPLAMERMQVKHLPQTVILSDAQALSPMNKISSEQQVNVIARISESGQANKQPGDIEMKSGPFSVNQKDAIRLELK